jgi:electron transfer flavoprotein beta subunit
LAELLDYPMATFAATIKEEADSVLVGREVDGGTMNARLRFPAVVTVDLRIVASDSVYSKATAPTFKYNEGVRFAPLPAIMKAKKKPLDVLELGTLVSGATLTTEYVKFVAPAGRKAGVRVASVAELVSKLKNESRVL